MNFKRGIVTLYYKILTLVLYKPLFKKVGTNSIIRKPILIHNGKYIEIGCRTRIRNGLRIETIDTYRIPKLKIGDNCNIEQNVHIICSGEILIGNNCSITANCSIVDTEHPYEEVSTTKIGERLNKDKKTIEIGDNCFLGIGSVVLPNVKLGDYCIVGANSVITKSFPAYSVIAGNPARMIKRYDLEKKIWRKTNENGDFTDEI